MAEEKNYGNSYFTPRNIIIYVIVALVVYGAVYFLYLKKDNTSPYRAPTTQTSQVDQAAMTMTVSLGTQNDSGEEGTATLTETDGKTIVSIALTGAPADVLQPAHIHSGACPTPGEVVYPLTNVVNGTSETVLDVDLATLKQAMPLAVNVHKSTPEITVYVACGDFQ